MQVSEVLRALSDGRFGYYCPGCQALHVTPFEVHLKDFNVTKPSFTGRIRVGRTANQFCEHTIHAGMIAFAANCRHKLKGATVALPPLPPEYQDSRPHG